jgi:hypothetical protein
MPVEPHRGKAARGVKSANRQAGGAPVASADRARLDVAAAVCGSTAGALASCGAAAGVGAGAATGVASGGLTAAGSDALAESTFGVAAVASAAAGPPSQAQATSAKAPARIESHVTPIVDSPPAVWRRFDKVLAVCRSARKSLTGAISFGSRPWAG